MRFSHVKLENWRNFPHVEVPLQHRVFLVGANASGKSNFLDVFRFLRDIASSGGGFQKAIQDRGGVSRIRSLAARRQSDVIIEVAMSEREQPLWRYRLAFAQDSQRTPLVREEKVWRDEEPILNRPDEHDESDPARLRQTNLEQTIANLDFRAIAEFFGSVRYYHIVPQLVRDPERSLGRRDDPFGGDLLERMARTNKKTRDAKLRRIREVLGIAVPQLRQLRLEPDERGVHHLRANYEHWRPQGAWQAESDFSDGTLRLIGLLWALQEGSGPLLLEEPELSLHPAIVRNLAQMMRRMGRVQRGIRQVLVSTHSSDLLMDEGIGADEVLLVMPGGEGSSIKVGASIEAVARALQAGLTVADAVLPLTQPAEAQRLAIFGDS